MDLRPKRRKNKDNPYKLSCIKDKNLYFITFKDSRGILQNIKVTLEVFNLFNDYELKDISFMNEYDNHIEHINLEEEQLYMRMFDKPKDLSQQVLEKIRVKELMIEIKNLPEIQRRRFVKYYFENKTYDEIALEEHCTKMAIKFSIDKAFEKISKKLQK